MDITREKVDALVALVRDSYPNWHSFADPDFIKDEIDYKKAASSKAKQLLNKNEFQALIKSNEFDAITKRLEDVAQSTNMLWLSMPKAGDLNVLYQETLDKPSFCRAFYEFLYGQGDSPERFDRYIGYLVKNELPNKWALPTFLLFLLEPETDFYIRPAVIKWLYTFFDQPKGWAPTPSGTAYRQIIDFVMSLKGELTKYSPKDMVDVQSFIWAAHNSVKQHSGDIPETTREDILETLSAFDEKLRDSKKWTNWEQNQAHKYAIEHEGRLYPVKQIITMATGMPASKFTGGYQANTYIESYGFTTTRLHEDVCYWKIAPGENAWNWAACLKNNYMAIGWEEFGDISRLSPEEFETKRAGFERELKQQGEIGWSKGGANQAWVFAHEIKAGDRIIANKGTTQIIGVGTVVGNYYFVPSERHGHRIPVRWDSTSVINVDKQGWRQTLIKLDEKTFNELTGQARPLFTDQTFTLLAGLHETPTRDFYNEHKTEIKDHVEESLSSLMKTVAQQVSISVKNKMEIESRIMARIVKNDFGRAGAWDYYWGAFYPKGGKRTEDAQLYAVINKDSLRFGFGIGADGSESRKQFVKNCRENQKELQRILAPSLSGANLVFGDAADSTITWSEWLNDPAGPGVNVAVRLLRDEVMNRPGTQIISLVVETFERLFPLVLLATEADPMSVLLAPSVETIETNPEYTLAALAADTFFELKEVERWVRALARKKQVIFYGPPGTGKTYLAEHLARHLIGGGDGFSDVIQFHPAYAYEDFMQGIRPESDVDGNLRYPLVSGRFLSFCQRAGTRTGECVLIIDEVNRANLSRVFGELMYLLEYRKKEIPLAGGGRFMIPDNVRIIGTMNTADRSIALVDHALRRRFAFLGLYPNYDVISRFHAETGFAVEGLIETLRRLNQEIGDRHYEIGMSFFLDRDLSANIEDIWRMEIEPYLEEYFFDRPDKAATFYWTEIADTILP